MINHKEKCGDDNLCAKKTSNESHLYCKKHFHKNPLSFRIIADLEADNEIDTSNIGDKTTIFLKQNPVLNGYYIVSELEDISESGYCEGKNNVDWYVNETKKLENKTAFYFKNTKKDIIMTTKDGEDYRKNNFCRFC